MAGYFRKAEELNYVGSYKAGQELANGDVVSITADGVKKLTAAGNAEFRIAEKINLFGKDALVLVCTAVGTGEIYIVENEWEDYLDTGDFNVADYTVKIGHYVKMRRPNINDEIVVSVAKALYDALNVGDIVTPAAGGSFAKKS